LRIVIVKKTLVTNLIYSGQQIYSDSIKCPQPTTSNTGRGGTTISITAFSIIEVGLEQAPFVFLFLFFSSFEHVKSLLIMGQNNIKNSSLKCDFHIINYE
jgi:hypothetical protein